MIDSLKALSLKNDINIMKVEFVGLWICYMYIMCIMYFFPLLQCNVSSEVIIFISFCFSDLIFWRALVHLTSFIRMNDLNDVCKVCTNVLNILNWNVLHPLLFPRKMCVINFSGLSRKAEKKKKRNNKGSGKQGY